MRITSASARARARGSCTARDATRAKAWTARQRLAHAYEPSYFVNDALSFSTTVELSYNPDWLLWRQENQLATYRSSLAYLAAGTTWLIDPKQELRLRLEAIGLDAEARQAWRGLDLEAVATEETVPDFSLRNLGFQVRYRYELAPLSYLYVAYVRGGPLCQEALGDSFGVGANSAMPSICATASSCW